MEGHRSIEKERDSRYQWKRLALYVYLCSFPELEGGGMSCPFAIDHSPLCPYSVLPNPSPSPSPEAILLALEAIVAVVKPKHLQQQMTVAFSAIPFLYTNTGTLQTQPPTPLPLPPLPAPRHILLLFSYLDPVSFQGVDVKVRDFLGSCSIVSAFPCPLTSLTCCSVVQPAKKLRILGEVDALLVLKSTSCPT